jgi:DNA-binding transcriptional ArsR family regulator
VVAVDVLSRVRDIATSDRQQYDADYEAMTTFKEIADAYGLALLVNHHDRKAKSSDWLTTVSGTRGVTGAADAVMLLSKERGRADGVLSITGRDVEEAQHALKFDAGQWLLLDGPVEAYTTSATRARILGLLRETPGLRPSEVADRLDGLSRDNAKQTLSRMREAGQVVADGDGRYRLGDTQTPVTPVTVSPGGPDTQSPVTGVTVSPPSRRGAVTGDGSDTFRGVTRPRGDSEPLTLTTITGCTVEEWMSGIEQGYADGLRPTHLDRLADYCDGCPEDQPPRRPQAVTTASTNLTAYYVCAEGHAWASSYADLDLILEAA